MRPRIVAIALALALTALPASAHDFWLQPERFEAAPGERLDTTFYVGHGADQRVWNAPVSRVVKFFSAGPEGVVDLSGALGSSPVAGRAALRFARPGIHVVALVSNHAESSLAAAKFNAYAQEEGLTPILEARARQGTTAAEGREIYSRRAKAIVKVGGGDAAMPHVTRALGLTLEIVPERNPYALARGEALPVRVEYEGAALAGAQLKIMPLGKAAPPRLARTDAEGRVVLAGLESGGWLLVVVWSRPIAGNPRADFETVFSSLTFARP